jgi:hypothetical protein
MTWSEVKRSDSCDVTCGLISTARTITCDLGGSGPSAITKGNLCERSIPRGKQFRKNEPYWHSIDVRHSTRPLESSENNSFGDRKSRCDSSQMERSTSFHSIRFSSVPFHDFSKSFSISYLLALENRIAHESFHFLRYIQFNRVAATSQYLSRLSLLF